ncbi:MAG: hypothetical protein GY851_11785, partial [bacterium]|nr:hypothetical protein [bacterium]
PLTVNGWAAEQPDEVYDPNGLFDYINGAAEIYRAFGVQRVLARTYEKPGAAEILVDVYDMGSPEGAYAAYHHDLREGRNVGIGAESEYVDGSLAFWKGRYFVSIIPFEGTDESRAAAMSIGRHIESTIPRRGSPPRIVKLLPPRNLVASRVSMFRDQATLNSHFYLEDNLFRLGPDTEGVIARYKPENVPSDSLITLMIVQYPTAGEARLAHVDVLASCVPNASADNTAQMEDGTWSGAWLQGNRIVAVFGAPTKAEAVLLLNQV